MKSEIPSTLSVTPPMRPLYYGIRELKSPMDVVVGHRLLLSAFFLIRVL